MSTLLIAQQHGPRGAAHLMILGGVVVAVVVVIGVRELRLRRTSKDGEIEDRHSREEQRRRDGGPR